MEEILVLGGEHPARWLGRDRRVTLRWRWLPLNQSDSTRSELGTLRQAADELPEEFILFFSDSVFESKALADLQAAARDGKLVRATLPPDSPGGGKRASLYLFTPAITRRLADTDGLEDVEAFAAQLRAQGRMETIEVPERLWPRTTDREELRCIHRELTHFHLKPSDGVFAKFNKLVVAEPLIRFFLRTPATPNFITLLGLLIALGSGWAFVQGSYGWSLVGALLAYFSAIMDHIDGMVARLKFLESNFGVWFESAVDVASYLSIFIGLAVGLYRETGSVHHLVVGGLFVLGTLLSLLTTSWQRKLASSDNPTDYVNRIYRRLEERPQNVFHWFTRRCYFLTRRAVLPFFILLFCLLDLRVLLLGWVTLGSHLVWTLTLYNNRLFRRSPAEPYSAKSKTA